jgi:hypothetical protein
MQRMYEELGKKEFEYKSKKTELVDLLRGGDGGGKAEERAAEVVKKHQVRAASRAAEVVKKHQVGGRWVLK